MDYEIKYSKRKSLSLQVTRDLKVIVRAPYRLSKKYIDDFVCKRSQWIIDTIDRIKSRRINPYIYSKDEINEMKEKTLKIVAPRVEYFAAIMGVKPSKVGASSAKRRFASCNSQGHLNFSFRLCLYPTEAIDYVIVHELSHMKEMNHSKRFWATVEKYMPDYKERQKLLKE